MSEMEKVNWIVEGMTCSNCALSVNKVLVKQGMKFVAVNPINGEVFFETGTLNDNLAKAKKNIELLGYSVITEGKPKTVKSNKFLGTIIQKFWFCLPFTLLLMLAHFGIGFHIPFLHNRRLLFN